MFEQGDIVSVVFAFTNATDTKKRAALIIPNQKVNQTGDYVVANNLKSIK